MTYSERGRYVERYVIWLKKDSGHMDYRQYMITHKLDIYHVVYGSEFKDYIIYYDT